MESRSEEIRTPTGSLVRRERLLETLLDLTRLPPDSRVPLHQIVVGALELFFDIEAAVVWEITSSGLQARAVVSRKADHAAEVNTPAADDFVAIVLREARTAVLNDVSLRPDLQLISLADSPTARAVLCADPAG